MGKDQAMPRANDRQARLRRMASRGRIRNTCGRKRNALCERRRLDRVLRASGGATLYAATLARLGIALGLRPTAFYGQVETSGG